MSKYGNTKITYDGIKFDSKLEANFYIYLKEQLRDGLINTFELQPKFVLQEKFEKHGKKHREITYTADFRVFNNDGTSYIIDCKGMETIEFRLKKKLYLCKFEEPLYCITYVKKYGGWIELDDYKKAKRENLKQSKKL